VFQGEVSTRSVDAQPNDKLRVYFYAKPSVPLGHYRVWSGKKWIDDQPTEIRGEDIGIVLDSMNTPSYGGEIGLSLCISYVSALNAKLNFDAEAASTPFDQARISAEAKWKEYFSRAEIKTPDRDLETLFYSTLYFSAIMPTNFTDVNHEYRGFGNTIGKAENFTYRTDLSLWDTFRTAHPLYNLIAPEIQRDTVLSLMEMAKENHGVFPRLAYGTTSSKYMFGSPANFVLSEAYAKGIHDFDTESALLSMWKGANEDPFTREPECVLHGYCPSDEIPQSVSKTVENSWADFAAAELAHASGNPSMELRFRENEVGFRHVWDPSTRYFRPKNSAGEFTAFNPNMTSYFAFIYKPAIAYAEGGPNHYRFSAPHHAQELISLFGGPAEFVTELEKFMDGHSPRRSALYPGANYWHGDEHNIHAPYLFNEAGRPDLTQKWVRWILRDRYATTPDGLDGNDDAGTLSAWYVLSSLGLYPQSGTDRYWLGSPAVDEATFARGQSSENVYVKQVALNGKRLCASTVLHQALVDSTLEFQMSATPVATYTCSP
jgi:predicted alpha-1,2-mannosidase